MSAVISNKYDFIVLFDVENGNPNGDPDAGNMPRVNPETGLGLVTDVCLKRKIRNYVETWAGVEHRNISYGIYVKENEYLVNNDNRALEDAQVKALEKRLSEIGKESKKGIKGDKRETLDERDKAVVGFMCRNFYDIRAFGAVMTTFTQGDYNCGQVRGPVQLGFARSIDPINPQGVTVTRVTATKEGTPKGIVGPKYIVPYALYKVEGHVSANLARKTTGFSEEDLELLWKAIINMFENDHSAVRGNMAVRELIVFKHSNELGNAPAYKLFERVKVSRKEEVKVPRVYEDYTVEVDTESLPNGVTCERKL